MCWIITGLPWSPKYSASDTDGLLAVPVLLTLFTAVSANGNSWGIPIGAIFDREDLISQKAFKFALKRHQQESWSRDPYFRFNASNTVDIINTEDNFQLASAICRQMSHGVFAILGQKSVLSADIVQSLTSTFHMPYITPSLTPSTFRSSDSSFELHMRPDHTRALIDIIENLGWKHVHFLYDSDEGLQRFQHIHKMMRNGTVQWFSVVRFTDINDIHDDLRLADVPDNKTVVKAFVVDLSSEEAYRKVLKQDIKINGQANYYRVVKPENQEIEIETFCQKPWSRVEKALFPDKNQLKISRIPEVGMNKFGYHYLFGTLDFKSLNLSRYRHGGVNVTGFQLLDEPEDESPAEDDGSQDFTMSRTPDEASRGKWSQGFVPEKLPIKAALTVDSLKLIESAVSYLLKNDSEVFRHTFRRGELYNLNKTKGVPCSTRPPTPWMFGRTLFDLMREVDPVPEGLSGTLQFDQDGYRKDYSLGVYSMALDHGLQRIGTWSPSHSFVSIHNGNYTGFDPDKQMNESMIITSILSEPFLFRKKRKDGEPVLMGNDRFEGFAVDLAKKLAEYVRFNFEFRVVADGSYGTKNEENGTWNGMMGELIDGTADLAVAPLTITADRERYVDFSKHFMEIGVTIMIKKPQSQRPGVFSFMEPLSLEVWLCIIVAYLTVSVGLFLVSRFSPVEWRRVKGEGQYENDFSLFNSFWFSMGALMFQGSDTCPRSISGRIIGGAWWFFVLIIISSYTANLAAFLTIERMVTPIESADDLANHPTIKYGAVESGSTLQFFVNSEIPVYRQMGEYMMAHPEVLVQTNEEGIKRVRDSKGKYAFLAESALVDYVNNRKPCETTSVGGKLNNKGFGVATKRNSPLRQAINVAVLKLKEEGTLHTLHQTWWIRKGQCGGTSGNKKGKLGKLSLTLSNVAGIFYILIVGLVLAIILGVTEFTCFRAKNKREDTCTITGDGCLKPNDVLTNDGYLKNTNTITTLCTTPNDREDWEVAQEFNGTQVHSQRPAPPSYDACIGFEKFGTGPDPDTEVKFL
ncbi:hypothetical protein RRG08_040059 [Elysia crispata]|uniref:Glutamate receptor n=1 Tax=Elysia crispata TaxID=231223 RepID=A0AAE0XWJ0_9GAST|nr:hypothetical protein RRG08_040059 [Elysia crispata]